MKNLSLVLATTFAVLAVGPAALAIAAPVPQAPYKNCSRAQPKNYCNIPSNSDKYQPKLDWDGDGIGCEC